MIERRRRPFACDFKSDTATFYRCPWELYSQETLSETHRVWETILGSSRRGDLVSALPRASGQGATLKEARENLKEAVAVVLQANRELAEESISARK
jgi:hypothetical protein